ncbi:MAG: Fe-S protein assembly chaperone HscA [Alphaproteobacteria bacterium]|nr:Fe-S protein assembly chaperone HscA [Alphaproteobacteria bacterium]
MSLLQIHEPGQTPAPHAKGAAVGIDLGTTNSVVAVAGADGIDVIRDARGNGLLPSVVAYTDDGVLVGEPARRVLLDQPDRVVASVKRLMGRAATDLATLGGTLPYDIEPGKAGGMVRLRVGGMVLSPVEVSADILRALRARAEAALGHTVDRAVVTVPAYFDDAARAATKDAARLAGLEVLRLVNEPTAAALAYGLDKGAEGLFAVFDLGGGTFDVSLLMMEKGVFRVIATGGDAALGGDDFDRKVAELFLAERKGAVAEALDPSDAKLILATSRLAKECLTWQDRGEWAVEIGGRMTRHTLDTARLEAAIGPLVDRAIAITERTLIEADVTPADVAGVVLVGGSTRVPLVRRRVAQLFGREPLADINPDEVVAVGAAIQAELLTVGGGALLLDVTPLSLGLETMGGLVERIVERNVPIPLAQAQEFTTFQDGQTAMAIHVVQGERETVDACRSLARFELRGIPPMVAGSAHIRVTFAIDADGLLTVTAREQTSGVESEVAVKPSYGLGDGEIERMLRDSIVNARDDMARRMMVEARVDAERLAAAVAGAVAADGDLLDEDERSAIEGALVAVRAAIAGVDREAILVATEALERTTAPFAQRRMDRNIGRALTGVSVDRLAAVIDTPAAR